MFWQSLQATFETFCRDVVQFGSYFFLDQTCQINGHFGYIWMELIEQKDQLGCLWDILSANKISSSKVRHVLYCISAFCVAPAGLKYATIFVYCCAIIR